MFVPAPCSAPCVSLPSDSRRHGDERQLAISRLRPCRPTAHALERSTPPCLPMSRRLHAQPRTHPLLIPWFSWMASEHYTTRLVPPPPTCSERSRVLCAVLPLLHGRPVNRASPADVEGWAGHAQEAGCCGVALDHEVQVRAVRAPV